MRVGRHPIQRGETTRSMRQLSGLYVLLALASAPGVLAQSVTSPGGESLLTPGDSIRVTVWRKPEFSGDFVVGPDGTIMHPLYRTVRVAELPWRTAEANIRTFLSQFEETPQFVAEPLVRVAISGEVTRPQVFAVNPRTPLAEAVARAGGATPNGRRDRVRVFRPERDGTRRELVVDLEHPERGLALSPVHSGDQIVIDRRRSFLRDVLVPALTVVGSIASVGLLVERATRGN
ncbi:MAG: SLBB domain-containing protein [Gemmatimonadales bacterium]|nr:SLBB domain-containing protein [Gemmatimonadales bacterium]